MSSLSRVSIPNTVKKTIQDIKEIAGNHSDDEIYAMLKECSMDPNETTQRLLYQDTFHEVKRKRDKKKENVNIRESADSRWRPAPQGRGGRSGRPNEFPRYNSQAVCPDAGVGRNGIYVKENGVNRGSDKAGILDLPVSLDMENKAASSLPGMANGNFNTPNGSSILGPPSQMATGGGTNFSVNFTKVRNAPEPHVNGKITPPSGVNISRERSTPNPKHIVPPPSVLGVYSSASDPVLVPSVDSQVPGAVGTIKREVRVQRAAVEPNSDVPDDTISSTCQEIADSSQMTVKSLGAENSQQLELSEPSSSQGGSISRPSSNYGSRPQQISGPQKAVGPGREWKPKPMNSNAALASGEVAMLKIETVTDEAGVESVPELTESVSEVAIMPLQKKLEEVHFSDSQHVIIPNHLHVAESERSGLSFGSFEAGFGVTTSYIGGHDAEKSYTPLSESPRETEEVAEESFSSNQETPEDAQEGENFDDSQSPTDVMENISPEEANISSSAVEDHDQPKFETVLPPEGPQFSVVHTVPTYSTFGLMPPMLGTQFAPFDSSDPQVQQSFDPANYYSQVYRAGTDGDGRFSPLLAPAAAAATKFNGNIALLSSQAGQSPQESGDFLIHSTSPTPHASQATGVMPSSISVSQQPVPVFRHPQAMHMPHFPPNYLPYGSYYSPYFVPPPTIHQFLSNSAFPQQPPSGSVYPTPVAATAAAATGIKYSLPQFKVGGTTGNPTHIGMQPGYAQFSSLPAGYSPSPACTTGGNSSGNEDLVPPQFKENNVCITAPQSEGGSAVWVPAPGREISGMQAGPFYNLPQGQHIAFAPSQTGHPAFAGIYHPTQTMGGATVHPLLQQSQAMTGAVEMVGPPAGVYQQQPQRTQVNWTNTY
ncbi:GBF-interacting protein 1-like isoform X3 [Papaver somniferum]|uniref:GBF-interacting protein 1-like isoform X3 n=1 Tax=Papaver somniferum TaxID=3469 RepID=UPI000E6F609A|nr:GBF-interacting protein 1-like isoform X3 [Papaver somniferum]